MNNLGKTIITILLMLLPLMLHAQTNCDAIFKEGQRLQQTMTIAAQNKAIQLFKKAKACYDSRERQDLCDQQIQTSQRIIQQLGAATPRRTVEETDTTTPNPQPVVEQPVEEVQKEPVKLDYKFDGKKIEFKAKDDKAVTIQIFCNYEWEVVSAPDWISYSINNKGDIVITASQNDTKDKREGEIVVASGDTQIKIPVYQKKPGLRDRIGI